MDTEGAARAGGTSGTGPRLVAAVSLAVTVVLWVLGSVLAVLNGDGGAALLGAGPAGFAVVGALIGWRRPQNRLWWIFCLAAVSMTVLGAGGEYAKRALVHAPGSLPAGSFVAWLADLAAIPTIGLLAGVLPQLFPTGRAVSRRWRPAVWAGVAYIALSSVGNGFVVQDLESVPGRPNPYAIPSARGLFAALIVLSGVCGLVAVAGGVLGLVVRWRRSRGAQRQQLKWFLAGVILLPIPIALHGVSNLVSDAGFSVAFVAIPAAMGVAILRYRLYDLDLVIRRTLIYALVSALIAGVYLGIVAAVEAAVGGS